MIKISADRVQVLTSSSEVKAYIDYAIPCGEGGLVIVGWLYDPAARVVAIGLLGNGRRNRFSRKSFDLIRLAHGVDNVYLERTTRLDVAHAMQASVTGTDHQHGFVLILPRAREGVRLAFEMVDGAVATLPIKPLSDAVEITRVLEASQPHSGAALAEGVKVAFGREDVLSLGRQAALYSREWQSVTEHFSVVDHAILVDGRYLLINGWIALPDSEIESVTLSSGNQRTDIMPQIVRYVRQDLYPRYPWSAASELLGFLCLTSGHQGSPASVMITVRARNGRQHTSECPVTRSDWSSFSRLLCEHNVELSRTALALFDNPDIRAPDRKLTANLDLARSRNIAAKHANLGVFIDDPNSLYANVDRVIPLGRDGLLVFGWFIDAVRPPQAIKVYDESGSAYPVQLCRLLRRDVVEAYSARFPGMSLRCGFVCRVPLATRAGDVRILAFDFGRFGEVWLKLPTHKPDVSGVALAREMISMIPDPMAMSHSLYELFEVMGPAIQSVTQRRSTEHLDIQVRQFGEAPEQVTCSMIVPLYGRCDFMRYQLAHFADDPEFAACDLIYVIDDPQLTAETLALAARYQPLFGVPFRVVWYDENRGFAGANNIGVQYARSDYVALVNSDVLPQQHGWLGLLRQALDTLDGAGAVGPLLEFADGSIQHAGMRPTEDASLPGFLLNTHAQMGTAWGDGTQPSEQVMLTAACLMLSRAEYLSLGGLDEGYLVGDFEDSDLCLALRKRGYRLWLVPEARLWHLERQSVSLYGASTLRQLITLYNGWRYRQRILSSELADPCKVEVSS